MPFHAEQTQGVPAHVVELCQWMQDRSMLDTDRNGSTGIRRGIATAEIKVPSLENIIRYSIDQLPWKQGMLLRIASILGMRFAPALLYELASAETQLSQEDLMPHFEGLVNSGWLTDFGDAWQVITIMMHQSLKVCMREAFQPVCIIAVRLAHPPPPPPPPSLLDVHTV